MSVVSAYVGKLKPGKLDQAVELGSLAKKVLERHGAKDTRMLGTALGAESYGSTVFSTEHESNQAFGAFYDKIMADDELLSLMQRAEGPDSPYVSTMLTTAAEIPLGRKTTAKHGKVVAVYISRPAPGRFEGAVTLGNNAFDFAEKHGAKNCRLLQQSAAGSQSDSLVAVMECESMAAYGKLLDAWTNDAAGQAIGMLIQSSDSPIVMSSHEVYVDIPI